MDKRKILFAMMLLVTSFTRAQVSITPQAPPFGVLVKTQLWTVLLVNNSGRPISARISLSLVDEKTNQSVLTGNTLPFILDKGPHQMQAKDLGPIAYTYGGVTLPGEQDPNGLLPVGNYQACYTLLAGDKSSVAVENCIQLAVDPLSPPLLNTPADEGQVSTPWPEFTWLPPTPANMFSDLSYDLVLVEVLPGQGKADAIEENIPVFTVGLVKDLFLNYPSSYAALDTSRLYAWRIVAMNNGQPAAMSEIWTFKVVAPTKLSIHSQFTPYLDLERGLGPTVATVGNAAGSLRFNYDNDAADTSTHYVIISLDDRGSPVVQQGQVSLNRGLNLLEIPLSKTAGFAEKKIYLFQLTNSRKETWSVKFTK
jgi:hypothetical protein